MAVERRFSNLFPTGEEAHAFETAVRGAALEAGLSVGLARRDRPLRGRAAWRDKAGSARLSTRARLHRPKRSHARPARYRRSMLRCGKIISLCSSDTHTRGSSTWTIGAPISTRFRRVSAPWPRSSPTPATCRPATLRACSPRRRPGCGTVSCRGRASPSASLRGASSSIERSGSGSGSPTAGTREALAKRRAAVPRHGRTAGIGSPAPVGCPESLSRRPARPIRRGIRRPLNCLWTL